MASEAYAKAGVDPRLIHPFKRIIASVADRTRTFPLNRWHVFVDNDGTYQYTGDDTCVWARPVIEGAGHKPGVADWMRKYSGLDLPFYKYPAIDTVRMATNDLIVQGAKPVTLNDEIAACSSGWFSDLGRAQEIADGFFEACQSAGCALVGGESPAMKLLLRDDGPIGGTPLMSASVTGIITPPRRRPRPDLLRAGDRILGARSSGYHANGYTLLIERAMLLKDKFMTRLPSGKTFGEVALVPTACYVDLVAYLLGNGVELHGLQPITGDGVAKIAFDSREFTYRIENWPEPSESRQFLNELGLTQQECLTTFNCDIGFVVFVPPDEVTRAQQAAQRAGHELYDLGVVEDGVRGTIFGPEHDLWLPPPGA